MAKNNRNANTRTTSVYEKRLMLALQEAVRVGLTMENTQMHIEMFNELYEAGYQFVERVALSRYRSWLAGWQIDIAETARDVTSKMLWEKLNYIMHSHNPVQCRGLIIDAAEQSVIDLIRKESRAKNDRRIKDKNSTAQQDGQANDKKEERQSTANVYLSDIMLETVASNMNTEAEYMLKETYLEVLEGLKQNDSMHQVISFLGTKLVGYTPSELMQVFFTKGEDALCRMVLRKSLPSDFTFDYYKDAAFLSGNLGWENYDAKELPQRISHASDRAKNKLRRSMTKGL